MRRGVAVLVGSLRKGSYNRMAAKAIIGLAPVSLDPQIVEIGDLALYNQDLDTDTNRPSAWVRFRDEVRPAAGLLFVTPEYNRSVPGVLKNAIDVGSRPYGQSVFAGKPGAVMSVSPGVIGGFGANHHLRQSLVFLDVLAMPQPEAYIGGAAKHFNEAGELVDDSTRGFFKMFIDAFAAWMDRLG
ncbi:MAG TPA: NAD(P)H-dependent oxidoreductase [Caulobacteraceae bacterium]|jgi:chromate reductase